METAPFESGTAALKDEPPKVLVGRKKQKERKRKLSQEDKEIILSLDNVTSELSFAYRGFELARDDALIDSFIFEIMALNKRYEYYIRLCRERGLVADGFAARR